MTDDLASFLDDHSANMADVSYTLQTGRKSFRHKRIVAASSCEEAAKLLRERKPNQVITTNNRNKDTPVVFMFPGQGSQHLNMARELYSVRIRFCEAR